MNRALPALLLAIPSLLMAQQPSVSIAPYQGNARGAFSLVSDDYGRHYYGDVEIIEKACDEAGVFLTFAVNTHNNIEQSIENYDCWEVARRLFAKGHEFACHSSTHNGADWAETMDFEINENQKAIEENIPGCQSLLFLFPNKSEDNNPPDYPPGNELDFIRSHRFIGARPNRGGGIGKGVTTPELVVKDPFHIPTSFWHEWTMEDVESRIQMATNNGGWMILSIHNVNKGSWGPIDTATFTALLARLKTARESGDLMVEPVQKTLMYLLEREAYVAAIEQQGEDYIVTLTKQHPIASSPMVDESIFDVELTFLVQLPGRFEVKTVTQNANEIPFERSEGFWLFDARPDGGPIVLSQGSTSQISQFTNEGRSQTSHAE